jgi:multidrug efflux pump
MGGVVGRLFREFAVTLSIAIVFSALVSLTLTPMMCSRLLRPHGAERGAARRRGLSGFLYRLSERLFDGMRNAYGRALDWVLRHQRWVQVITAGTVGLTVFLFVTVPKGLFPQRTTG